MVSSLVFVSGVLAQSTVPPKVVFEALPSHQLISRGEPVVLVLTLRNLSEIPAFVRRPTENARVDFRVVGPDGTEILRHGEGRIEPKAHFLSDFTVLEAYQEISAERVISLQGGDGFAFDKPGEYWVTAEFSMGTPEELAPFAGETKIPAGSFRSAKVAFCIENCLRNKVSAVDLAVSKDQNTISQTAIETVRVFYTSVVRYRPLGLPEGDAKRVLWPLLSKRLAQELTSLEACENDYYSRYGEQLRKNHFKPAIPWLEEGLFSGGDEEANPASFTILGGEMIGTNRVEVHLRFAFVDTDFGHHNDFEYEGIATVLLEDGRFVVDDFVSLDRNYKLHHLSEGYSECKGGRWVGVTAESETDSAAVRVDSSKP